MLIGLKAYGEVHAALAALPLTRLRRPEMYRGRHFGFGSCLWLSCIEPLGIWLGFGAFGLLRHSVLRSVSASVQWPLGLGVGSIVLVIGHLALVWAIGVNISPCRARSGDVTDAMRPAQNAPEEPKKHRRFMKPSVATDPVAENQNALRPNALKNQGVEHQAQHNHMRPSWMIEILEP